MYPHSWYVQIFLVHFKILKKKRSHRYLFAEMQNWLRFMKWLKVSCEDFIHTCQQQIWDFPDGGANVKRVGSNILLFGQDFPKTAWKWRKVDREGGKGMFPKFVHIDPLLPILRPGWLISKLSLVGGINLCNKIDFKITWLNKVCIKITHWLWQLIITVCKSSCGKVMFSQACVKNSVHRQYIPWADTPWADPLLGIHPSPPRWPLKWTIRLLLECNLVPY